MAPVSSPLWHHAQRQRLREKRDEKLRSQSTAAAGVGLSEAELAVRRESAAVAAEELLQQEEEEAARAASRRAAKARKKKGEGLGHSEVLGRCEGVGTGEVQGRDEWLMRGGLYCEDIRRGTRLLV